MASSRKSSRSKVALELAARAGAPLIAGCVAWFECRHHARHRAGDHVLFIGAVVTCGRRKLMHRLLDAGFKVHPQAGGCHSYVLERPDMLRELLN